MLTITVNAKRKAERIILANRGSHKMHWQKFYCTNNEGDIVTKYIIFYYPKHH